MANLGHDLARNTIALLRDKGIEPAPRRGRTLSWSTFLKAHAGAIGAADFFSVEVLTRGGLVRYLVMFLIDLKTRRVHVAGISSCIDGAFMAQVGFSLDVSRSVASGEKIDLRAALTSDDGTAVLEAHRHHGATEVDLNAESFSFSAASVKLKGLDLSSAIANGTAHAERSEEGAVESNGKLSIAKLKLPPVKVGPVALAIGGTVRIIWKGSPRRSRRDYARRCARRGSGRRQDTRRVRQGRDRHR